MSHKHHLPSQDLMFPKTLHDDKHKFGAVDVPIVTISATFRKELQKSFGEKVDDENELVFSRAHYSMAVAILEEAERQKKSAWLVDPTNYISEKKWKQVKFFVQIGRIVARNKVLKKIKDIADRVIRKNRTISKAVESPLLYVARLTEKPIISLHYEAGNVLAKDGINVLQVVTDPFVHDTYVLHVDKQNISFVVFDIETKKQFLDKAKSFGKKVSSDKIVVTGPPIDNRIIMSRKNKVPGEFEKRGLRLCVTTSGLGSNKQEIKKILEDLLPVCESLNISLLLYASTHKDFYEMYIDLCQKNKIKFGNEKSPAQVRVIYSESIIEANQLLIEYAFPWADGFVTKPSGDMAYDASASGSFLLLLEPWGEWEVKIEDIFSSLGVSIKADVDGFVEQLNALFKSGWFKKAQANALNINDKFLKGSKNIVDLQGKLSYNE